MSRLHEFITRIRNTKTMAEERAEYQKEMAVIRESFAKNEENMRPRNVTKLLFINMSGQETNFGQMECLKLITGNTLIEKRIGYLGLTQLFHEKSELLMMATNRIRVDLAHSNNNLVGLALCVLSEICTPELATELYKEVLKCCVSTSKFIKKKAILTSIKLLKKAPEFLNEFLPAIIESLEKDKNHGVLLSVFAFLENAIAIDESKGEEIFKYMETISRVYKSIITDNNAEYEISGAQDPFLQVSILRFLRSLKKLPMSNNPNFMRHYGEILVTSHDGVCAKLTGAIKNGANAVLFECFQCFMTIPPNPTLSTYSENVLTRFVTVKDANSKYLSLFNLGLMAKHDLAVAKRYKDLIIECLEENDLLIRVMALDLLYLIAAPENVASIIKELLNVLLSATDEEFIPELSLKICLIVEKYSESRRWQFDTILKVLILADKSVKEDSSKSLVYLITTTQELQQYCLAKLFFSSCQNIQNDTLCKVTMYLLGELSSALLRLSQVEVQEVNIIDLIEQVIFRPGAATETIEYGLTSLFKLYDKFSLKKRIMDMIRSFESHSELEVQKRACEYSKMLDPSWREERVKEICIPVPPFRGALTGFASIPIGDTTIDLSSENLTMPEKLEINYEAHIPAHIPQEPKIVGLPPIQGGKLPEPPTQPKKVNSLLDFDDEPAQIQSQPQTTKIQQPPQQIVNNQPKNNDPFDFLGLDIGGSQPQTHSQPPVQTQNQNLMGGDLMGFGFNQQPQQVQQPLQNNNGFGSNQGFFDGGLLGINPIQPQQPSQQPTQQPQNFGFDLLGGSQPQSFTQPQSQPQSFTQPPQQTQNSNTFKYKAYQTEHIELWLDCKKESDGNTRIIASFMNKTLSYIEQLSLQTAVMKYLKIAIQPLSGTNLAPSSKGEVTQLMTVTNSAIGQKPIVMKIKLGYVINGQKLAFEEKIEGIPLGF